MPRTFNAETYAQKEYLQHFPKIDYEPHTELKVVDRGFSADPEKKALLSAATRIDELTPFLGTQLDGIDLRQLTDQQKDELALLAAERGVLVFENQEISIEGLLDLARYYGPLHVHSTTGVPADPALAAVHVVFNDGTKPPDRLAKYKPMWHSDQSYEINTMGLTSLKMITAPKTGGDTIWCSAQAVFSSFSPGFQKYLETLSALHSSDKQKAQTIERGTYIRRPQTDCIHPVVRVHPVTGWKGLYVNPSYTRRIVGIPQAESDAILAFIFDQIKSRTEYQLRVRWRPGTIVMWDNRGLWHNATVDTYPRVRHALRATPVAERPMSVAEYEKTTGKVARDWYADTMEQFEAQAVAEEEAAKAAEEEAAKAEKTAA